MLWPNEVDGLRSIRLGSIETSIVYDNASDCPESLEDHHMAVVTQKVFYLQSKGCRGEASWHRFTGSGKSLLKQNATADRSL